MPESPSPALPEGVAPHHAVRKDGVRGALPVLLLGALLLAALLGLFGGGPSPTTTLTVPEARMQVAVPRTLRNGEFFEMRIIVDPRTTFTDLGVAVSPSLWQDITINTQIPAPAEEGMADGLFLFRYGPAKPGERLVVKIDGQINPPLTLGNRGTVALYDGDRRLGALPVTIKVFP